MYPICLLSMTSRVYYIEDIANYALNEAFSHSFHTECCAFVAFLKKGSCNLHTMLFCTLSVEVVQY